DRSSAGRRGGRGPVEVDRVPADLGRLRRPRGYSERTTRIAPARSPWLPPPAAADGTVPAVLAQLRSRAARRAPLGPPPRTTGPHTPPHARVAASAGSWAGHTKAGTAAPSNPPAR